MNMTTGNLVRLERRARLDHLEAMLAEMYARLVEIEAELARRRR